MALTRITSDGITDGTITGTDLTTNVDLVDNQKLRLGTGNDLEIYHNGNHSIIHDNGTGDLKIIGDDVIIQATNDDIMAKFIENGAVELYNDNSKKFETTSTGVHILGTLEGDNLKASNPGNNALLIQNPSNGIIGFGANNQTNQVTISTDGHLGIPSDSGKLRLGASEDLQIYHDGTNSRIQNSTGYLSIGTDNFSIFNNAANENILVANADDGVDLYFNGSKKFETTSGGVNVTGALTVNGSALASATNSPAFSAYRSSNYSPSNGSEVVIDFDQERFDTNSCYNFNNGRFTPTTAGNYQFNLNFFWSGTSSNKIKQAHGFIRKNGSENIGQFWHDANDSYKENRQGVSVSTIVAMNGSSDYVEAIGYCLVDSGSPNFNAQGATFSGFKLA